MTHEEFFNWLRSMQDDKRLSQNEVDTANELLTTTTPERLKAWLIEVNGWNAEQSKVGFMQLSKTGVDYIKKFEAYRAKPYQDSKAYGHLAMVILIGQTASAYHQVTKR